MSVKKYDVIIVGAGFAGLSCAIKSARLGLRVLVMDRKKDIGDGIRTTGILVKEVFDYLNVPSELLRKISNVRLYSPSQKFIDLQSDDYFFCTTDTPGLMRHLLQCAADCGVDIVLDHGFRAANNTENGYFIDSLNASCRFLVGADGARSAVADYFNMPKPKKFLIGTEYEYATDILNVDQFHCFLDQDLAPGYLGWIAPGVGITQVGLACHNHTKPDMKKFFDKIRHIVDVRDLPFHGNRGGLIPIDRPIRNSYRDRLIIIGDAASHVSPLTAGGIDYALRIGAALGDCMHDYIAGKTRISPGRAVQSAVPGFNAKHAMRFAFDNLCPNWLINIMFDTKLFSHMGQEIFFKPKSVD